MKKKIKRFIKWYILGYYHCDKCPYAWEERHYEGDCDCGCYIKGDIQDSCRLLPPFRSLLGYFRKKKTLYYFNHEYDGFVEFVEKQDKQLDCMAELLNKYVFDETELYIKNYKGEYVQVGEIYDHDFNFNTHNAVVYIVNDYENTIHPIKHKKLRQKWKELIKETFDRFIAVFRPYFCD